MKVKILYTFVHLNYGGAEVGLLTTLKNIDKNRFDCSVISIEKKGIIGETIESLGFKVYYLDKKAGILNFSILPRIIRILKIEKPDILHTSLFYANFFGRIASLFSKPPVVITEERSMYTEKRFYHVIIDKILSLLTDRIVVCSRSVLDFTSKQERIKNDKFYLIYNSVDSERFDIQKSKEALRERMGYAKELFVIGAVGSLIQKKGHIFLIKALSDLIKKIPSSKLIIVGDGEDREELIRAAAFYKLSDHIEFTGARSDIPELMKIMDVFVLPSFQEGFPRTLLEAMYIGLPVIASNVSGIPEIIKDGKNGFLVAPGDLNAIIDRISLLSEDKTIGADLGSEARKTIKSGYLPKHYMDRLERLYIELKEKKVK